MDEQEIYCQTCGNDLSKELNICVDTGSKSAYCYGNERFEKANNLRCIDEAIMRDGTSIVFPVYVTPEKARRGIVTGELVNFGLLEKEITAE